MTEGSSLLYGFCVTLTVLCFCLYVSFLLFGR
jgi:hypothetical protein